MGNFFKSSNKEKNSLYIILFIIALITCLFWLYETYFGYYIYIRFKELGPVTKNMPVYYKGFEIGKTIKVEPDNDYKHTIVKMILEHKDTRLPQNTFVIINQFPNGEKYLEFIYPNIPALKLLKSNDIIEGKSYYNLEQFMKGQSRSGLTDIVSENAITALSSADQTNKAIRIFFENATVVLKENRQSIKRTTKNTEKMTESLAKMAENLNQTSKKLNNSLDENKLKSTTENISTASENITSATENIKTTTTNINTATKDIDKTVKKIDAILSEAHVTTSNMNKITKGIHQTLGKRFAGMRIFFGKPIENSEVQDNCNKN